MGRARGAGPVDTADRRVALPAPGRLPHSTAAEGIVRLFHHGNDRLPPPPDHASPEDSPHCAKFAYAGAAVLTPVGRYRQPPGASRPPDGTASRRARIHPLGTAGLRAASWHTAVLAGWGTASGRPAWCTARGGAGAPGRGTARHGRTGTGRGPGRRQRTAAGDRGPGRASARRTDGLTSAIVAPHGWGGTSPGVVARARDANAYGRHSAAAHLLLPVHPGGSRLLVALVVLGVEPEVSGASVLVTDRGAVLVRFPDGTREEVPPAAETV
ncbi:hypothetical protein ABZT48_11700 [Streptomyces avermitilis]|uniref:hypothetical protein n=1 Tax=Streptomyces avermitilis TaxID=33903 RepID=UPI0033AF6425